MSLRKSNEFSFSGEDFNEIVKSALDKRAGLRFKAKGFSMSPCIKNGDLLTVYPLADVSIRWGDIAAFTCPRTKKVFIHRLVGKNGGRYLMKADNGFYSDGLISGENILGVVKKIEREGREISFGLGFKQLIIAFLSKIRILPLFFWSGRRIVNTIKGFFNE